MEEIKKEIQPYVGKIMNAVTDTGAIVAQLLGKGLKIHAVKVHKRVPIEEALKHFQNITKNSKKSYYKEMKNHYNFRNIPKTKFEPKTYRTKKVNKDISIVFGKLKD
jgi:ribosomal protein S21